MELGRVAVAVLLTATFIIGTVQSQPIPTLYNENTLRCSDDYLGGGGVYLGGDKCYMVYTGHHIRTWYRANEICESQGGHLVVFKDQEESNAIGRLVNSDPSEPHKSFWIGVHCPEENCATGAFDSYGNEVSENQASWADGQPDFTAGQCFYSMHNDAKDYIYDKPYVQSAGHCRIKRSFVCEKPAVPPDSFICLSKGFTSIENRCNGRHDCPDGSDEINCQSYCHYYLNQASGSFQLPVDFNQRKYGNSETCTWAIETPLGTNAFVNFSANFETEWGADIVQVYIGSIVEINAHLVTRLSGQYSKNQAYRSYNNMMFIKFSSDSNVTYSGFSATYGSFATSMTYETQSLIADYSPKTFSMPLHGVGEEDAFVGMTDYHFEIEASYPYELVTVEIKDLEKDLILGENDKIVFYDGKMPKSGTELLTLCKGCPDYTVITSTGRYLSILLITDKPVPSKFKFSYTQGCDVTLTSKHGMLFSPGYMGNIKYPNNIMCSWRIDVDEPITIYFETDLELEDNHRCIESSSDYLEIYEGSDANPLEALHTGDGFTALQLRNKAFQSLSGQLYLRFKTSPTANERGFMAKYSIDCPNPAYDENTLIDSGLTQTAPYHYTASMTLTCALGYGFHQQQIPFGQQSVQLNCLYKGEWDYKYIPRCTPNYCGDLPEINNGYVVESSGAVYGSVATYECYPGSELISRVGLPGNNKISCQASGFWQTAPICQTASCSLGLINLNPGFGSGDIRAGTGDGTTIGTIIDFNCDDGFEIDGDPVLICENDGRWSRQSPTCKRKTCRLPTITHASLSTTREFINFDEVVSVTCNTGYKHNDPTVTSMKCLADRSLSAIPECVDEDECARTIRVCQGHCKNTDGSYVCSCDSGYRLGADRVSCQDINECSEGTHKCDQGCDNNDGGYTCRCSLPYVLFSVDGLSGYFIPTGETGLTDEDTYILNKTCVLKECPTPTQVNNAKLLTKRPFHRFGDFIEFQCNFGMEPRSSVLQCSNTGDWIGSVPNCIPSTCPNDFNDFPLPVNQASFKPGPYSLGDKVDLNCTVAEEFSQRHRYCVYNKNNGDYELQGSSYECGVVSCGIPEGVPGSNFVVGGTQYGDSFEFRCSSGNTPQGSSSLTPNDYTVRCGKDGYWMFGNLQCHSQYCDDPGTPAGGIMIATSFADQSTVTFSCTKPGYTLTHENPLRCLGQNWNIARPECIDTQRPSIALANGQPCDGSYTIMGKRYQTLTSIPLPTVVYSDNDGIQSSTIEPISANMSATLESAMSVTYTVTDNSGNSASCVIRIVVEDETPPTITCPPQSNLTVYIDDENDTPTLNVGNSMFQINDPNNVVDLRDRITITPSLPTSFTFADLYQTYGFTATVRDLNNNEASCQAQIFVTRRSCTPNSFPTPLNAEKNCTSTGFLGYNCIITCNTGYTFQTAPGKSRTVSCQSGVNAGAWNAPFMPACVKDVTYPTLSCPSSETIFFSNDGEERYIDFTVLGYVASDLSGIKSRVFDTQSHTFAADRLYETTEVTLTVTDEAGLDSSCKFQYLALPREGSPLSYPVPLYANKTCDRNINNNGYDCILTCMDRYVFRDYGRSTLVKSIDDQGWDKVIPACVPDNTRPTVTCPYSRTLRLETESSIIDMEFGVTGFTDYTSNDDGGIRSNTFSPQSYRFTSADLYKTLQVSFTATDLNGNAESCQFFVHTLPAVCSPLSLPDPANGEKTCSPQANGWGCTLSCRNDYSFAHTTNPTEFISCVDGVEWTSQVPGCSPNSDVTSPVYFAEVEYKYQPADSGAPNISRDCLDFYENQQSRVTQLRQSDGTFVTATWHEAMASRMLTGCYTFAKVPFDVAINITFIKELFQTELTNIGNIGFPQFRQVVITYTFTMTSSNSSWASICRDWFFVNMAIVPNSFEFALNIPGNAANCHELRWDNAVALKSSGSRCTGNRFKDANDECRPCPPGSVSDSIQCTICPKGTYLNHPDDLTCTPCGGGGTTRFEGAYSAASCVAACQTGQFSDDGYQPCAACPKGTYTSNGLSCTSCGPTQTTTTVGSTSSASCIDKFTPKEPCGAGTEASGDNCVPCPVGYYRLPQQSQCVQCLPIAQTTTFIIGAVSQTSCIGMCGGGLISTDGKPPCSPCARGTYYINSTFCESCPIGYSTIREGSTRAQDCIEEELLRVKCPMGTFRDGFSCTNCPIGTYSSVEDAPQCTNCFGQSSTYHEGTTSITKCFATCAPGTTSTTGLSPCTPCGVGSWSFDATTCRPCPPETTTETNTASSEGQCIPKCGLGKFSVSGYNFDNSCRNCPANFYQDQTGQTSCKPCSTNQYTRIGQTGLTRIEDCLNTAFEDLCYSGRCEHGGTCRIQNHDYYCECASGYYGPTCNQIVNFCEINPCFNTGQCQNSLDGPICDCRGLATGDRCQNVIETCDENYCRNGGHCVNHPGYSTCLCPQGYGGTICESQSDVCVPNPCENGGNCEDTSFGHQLRRKCICATGYEGKNCETQIDFCQSTPCLYGGACVPQLNGYSCNCPPGYYGKNCENRQNPCAGIDCGGGECIDDYTLDEPRCLCQPGYYYGSLAQYSIRRERAPDILVTSVPELTGTIDDCRTRCNNDGGCASFTFSAATGSCYIWSQFDAFTPEYSGTYNHYAKIILQQVTDDFWTEWFDISGPASSNGMDDIELRADLNNIYGLNVCEGTEPIAAECRNVVTKNLVTGLLGITCDTNGLRCEGSTACSDYEVRYKCAAHRVFKRNSCSFRDNCYSSPCPAGSQCTSVGDSYLCSCSYGLSGRDCQINENDCVGEPCKNGGICLDRVGGWDCDCRPAAGYTGAQCDIKMDFCTGVTTCNFNGNCRSLTQTFVCDCYPGYEGRECETQTDFCVSNPCLNGGHCVPHFNGYTCNCTDGWTGNHCESLIDYCRNGGDITCKGECYNIFESYYCKCPPNTYGTNCDNSPNPCGVYNKCQNGGVCSYDIALAEMSCTCNDMRYTDDGCHILVDHCSPSMNECQNGATCHITSSGYRCECVKGYNGNKCENEIDECSGISCAGGATCVDYIGYYSCRCPLTKMGATCTRVYDPNYDIYFNHPEGLNYAWVPYPNQVDDVESMSVSLWVRFAVPGSHGTYFSMFIGDHIENSFKFMDFRHDGVRVYITTDGGITPYTLLPFSYDHIVNDGNWHSIVLNYNLAIGRMSLIKNSIKMTRPDVQNPDLIIPDRTFRFWSVIGCEFDQFTESCMMGNSFHGFVSQVNFYSRELDFDNEIALLVEDPRKVFDPFINVRLVWNEYILKIGSDRIIPSEASRVPCPGRCRTYSVLSRPTISVSKPCPEDKVVYSADRLTKVNWDEPAFEGAIRLIRPEFQNGGSYHWGTYQLTYIAVAVSGEKAICSFKLYVQSSRCETVQDPLMGSLVCDTDPANYKGCEASCFGSNSYLKDRVTPNKFTCDKTGSWNVEKRFNRFFFPPCGEIYNLPPRVSLSMAVSYEIGTKACFDATIDFESRTKEEFVILNSMMEGGGLCNDADCTGLDINVLCGATGQQGQIVSILEVTIPDCVRNTKVDGINMLTQDFITCSVLGKANILDFSDTIPKAEIEAHTYRITPTLVCPSGYVLMKEKCVRCGPGTFVNATRSSSGTQAYCEDCPIGKYQDEAGQYDCKPCGNDETTEMTGSYNSSFCKAKCQIGNYYSFNLEACVPCQEGYYQDEVGQFFCKFCERGQTTSQPGATTHLACKETCPSGEELADTGCVMCPIGFYRDEELSRTCQSCPVGKITEREGSTSAADCYIEACEAGSKLNVDLNTCELCPVGTYQEEKWQKTCISCGDPAKWRTDQEGSADSQDCKFYCSEGYQAQDVGTLSPYCEICPIGTFRNNLASYYGQCVPCPGNYRTEFEGSVNEFQCSIYKCPAGQIPNAANTACLNCPRGQYQPKQHETECIPCAAGTSTRDEGAIEASSCESFCPSGKEKSATGSCDLCNRGYFKDNLIDVFSDCTLCPIDRITTGQGAINVQDCNVGNCTEGFRTIGDTCEICPKDTYQDKWWQPNCIPCGTDEKTTAAGATSAEQCQLECPPGKQYAGDKCEECPRGTYKSQTLAALCDPCPSGFTTEGKGANDVSLCSLPACQAGFYLDRGAVPVDCKKCDYNTYQDKIWQEECIPCTAGLVTLFLGAAGVTDCVTDCDSGSEYNFVSMECDKCGRGYYRNKLDKLQPDCQLCDVNFITAGEGSVSITDCDVRNCTQPGEFINTDNQCEQCPRGTYLNEKWKTVCNECPDGYSTRNLGSTTVDQCIRTCPAGQYVTQNNECLPCEIGTYRTGLAGETCLPCPDGLLTPQPGAKDDSKCTLSPCEKGNYYIRATQECMGCARGTYQDQPGKFQCISCPFQIPFTPAIGADSVDLCNSPCLKGYQLNSVSLNCEVCPVGYYQESDYQFVCTQCPVEKAYTSSSGSTSFSDCKNICDAGNDCSDKANCISRADGYTCECYTNHISSQSGRFCEACEPGQYFVTGENRCTKCATGRYQPDEAKASCIPCPGGTKSQFDRTACTQCGVGTYSVSGASVCTPCPAGQYQPSTGQSECLTCPAGTEVNSDKTGCIPCPVGTYSGSTDSQCLACRAGQYQPETGQPACLTCSAGSEVNNDRTGCIKCAPGKYSVLSAAGCQACGARQYQPEEGKSSCLSCVNTESNADRTACINLCDLGHCKNGATCNVGPPITCSCGEWYYGDTCDNRYKSEQVAERNIEQIVIPVVIGVLALLLAIIIVAVACFVCLRKTPKPTQYSEFTGERVDKASVHSYGQSPYNFQNSKLMPGSEMVYDNQAYAGSQVAGDPAVFVA